MLQCTCDEMAVAFAARGVKSPSDPKGRVKIKARRSRIRYRFAQESADFFICPNCGTYAATLALGAHGPAGVINVVGLDIPELRDQPAMLSQPKGRNAGSTHAATRLPLDSDDCDRPLVERAIAKGPHLLLGSGQVE